MNSFDTLVGGGAVMLVVIATAAGIARCSHFYRLELTEHRNRELALDGLRGIAALMVVIHHAALSLQWLRTGTFHEAGTPLIQLFGPAGVILFFMLTGYLFWGKARAKKGGLPVWDLWRGRLYRVAPLYLFSLSLVLLVAAAETGGDWLALDNWRPLLRLLALGALSWHSVGPVSLDEYNAGVVWTLRYEWGFYLALPFIAWLALGRKIIGAALMFYALTFVCLWHGINLQPGLFFLLGMLCPGLLEDPQLRCKLKTPTAAALTLFAAFAIGWCCRGTLLTPVPSASVAAAVFPLFIAAAAGNHFFGFLSHPALRCLGAVSFSLYLIHGVVFRLEFRLLKAAGLTGLPPLNYWILIAVTAMATTLLCAVTYRWIEFPFLSARHTSRKGLRN